MTQIDANPNVDRSRRALPIALATVVATLVALNVLLKWLIPHVSERQEWIAGVMFGAWACESILFGAWVVLGIGAWAIRLLISVPCLLMLYVVPAMVRAHYVYVDRIDFFTIAVTVIMIFSASIALFSAVRWTTKWQIEPTGDVRIMTYAPFRFSNKYLWGVVTLYALLFGAASQLELSPTRPTPLTYRLGPSVYFSTASFRSAIASIVVVPTLAVPALLLRLRAKNQALWIAVALWLLVTLLAVASFVHADGAPPRMVLLYILLMQLGATVVGLLASVSLRWVGCRLIAGR